MKNKKQFSWLLDTPIAHRGLHGGNIPENSLSAFQNAVDHGYGIELDIYILKDGNVAVMHDPFLSRVCDKRGLINFLDIKKLNTYKLKKNGEHIPTLDEVLALVDGKVPLLIEFKSFTKVSHGLEKAALEILKNYPYKNVALQSFNRSVVRYLLANAPQYPVGQLASHRTAGIIFYGHGKLHFTHLTNPDFAAVDVHTMPNARDTSKKQYQKRPVLTWTIRNEKQYQKAIKLADNVIFEYIVPEELEKKYKNNTCDVE